jgi:hypothetical protein
LGSVLRPSAPLGDMRHKRADSVEAQVAYVCAGIGASTARFQVAGRPRQSRCGRVMPRVCCLEILCHLMRQTYRAARSLTGPLTSNTHKATQTTRNCYEPT